MKLEMTSNGILGRFIFNPNWGWDTFEIDGEVLQLGSYYNLKEYGQKGKTSQWWEDRHLTPARKPIIDWAASVINSEEFRVYKIEILEQCYQKIATEDCKLLAVYVDEARYMPATVYWSKSWIDRYHGINFACKYDNDNYISWSDLYDMGATDNFTNCPTVPNDRGHSYLVSQELYDKFCELIRQNKISKEIAKIQKQITEYTKNLASTAENLPSEKELKVKRKHYNDFVNEGGDGYIPSYLYQSRERQQFETDEIIRLRTKLEELQSQVKIERG